MPNKLQETVTSLPGFDPRVDNTPAAHEVALRADRLETERAKVMGGMAVLEAMNRKGAISAVTAGALEQKANKMQFEDSVWQRDLRRIRNLPAAPAATTPAERRLRGASELATEASAVDASLTNGQMLQVASEIAAQKTQAIDAQLESVYGDQLQSTDQELQQAS